MHILPRNLRKNAIIHFEFTVMVIENGFSLIYAWVSLMDISHALRDNDLYFASMTKLNMNTENAINDAYW